MITPSAARNVLDAICWRPQMRWIVTRITVLKPIRFLSVLRNEVQSKVSPASVKKWMRDASHFEPLVAGAGNGTDGTPRNTTLLRDVAYWIDAYPHVFDTSGDNTPAKYVAMLKRRVEKGQCFQRPYLGCREFAADFPPPRPATSPFPTRWRLAGCSMTLPFLPTGNRAAFFEARLEDGVMETRPEMVLTEESRREEVLECSYRR